MRPEWLRSRASGCAPSASGRHRLTAAPATLALAVLALLAAVAGCAPRDPDAAAKARRTDSLQVEARLQRYAFLVRRMDHAGIAGLFEDKGALVSEGRTIAGPDSIQQFLESFTGYQVLDEAIAADTTLVAPDSARQVGAWHQRVRVPDGRIVEASGRFEIRWARNASDQWMIRSMTTMPAR